VIRALGRAWVEPDGIGDWRRKRGRAPEGVLTEAEASARMLDLIRVHDAEQTLLERDAEERRRRGVTFRELARDYMRWLEEIEGAKPSTLRDYRSQLAEPGQAYRRGNGAARGLIMAALGARPAREVTTREIDELLRTIAATGVAPRTVKQGPSTCLRDLQLRQAAEHLRADVESGTARRSPARARRRPACLLFPRADRSGGTVAGGWQAPRLCTAGLDCG
jgi:hypothetical protein